MKTLLALVMVGLLGGCSATLTPELIAALAKDEASFCATTDVRGGVGTLAAPSGGYGQATFSFCRSNKDNATLSVSPDGALSLKNGN